MHRQANMSLDCSFKIKLQKNAFKNLLIHFSLRLKDFVFSIRNVDPKKRVYIYNLSENFKDILKALFSLTIYNIQFIF